MFNKKKKTEPAPTPAPKSQRPSANEKFNGPFPEEISVTKKLTYTPCVNAPAVDYVAHETFTDLSVASIGTTRVAVYKLVRVDEYKRVTLKNGALPNDPAATGGGN